MKDAKTWELKNMGGKCKAPGIREIWKYVKHIYDKGIYFGSHIYLPGPNKNIIT